MKPTVENGWVGAAWSSFTVSCGTFLSGAGKMGLPVRRSSTNRFPVLVGATSAGTTPDPVCRSTRLGCEPTSISHRS